jgi:hypothetical protein
MCGGRCRIGSIHRISIRNGWVRLLKLPVVLQTWNSHFLYAEIVTMGCCYGKLCNAQNAWLLNVHYIINVCVKLC